MAHTATIYVKLANAVNDYLDAKSPDQQMVETDEEIAEGDIVDILRTLGHIPQDASGYIEPQCREHDVVHMAVYLMDGLSTSHHSWVCIDRNGKIEVI